MEQHRALLTALLETNLLEEPSSTRNIGDDELPVELDLSYDDLRYQIVIWAGDALHISDFHRFERILWTLLRQLSNNQVGTGPAE